VSTGPTDPLAAILAEAERNRRQERASSASAGTISTPAVTGDSTVGAQSGPATGQTGGGNVVTLDASGRIPASMMPATAPEAPESYEHTQATASAVWTITHDLGGRPSVVVIDAAGREIQAAVEYPSLTTVVVRFGRPTAGSAELSL
jgi:hypothetical protein